MKIQTKRLDILSLSVALWKDFYLRRDQFEMNLGLDPSLSLMTEEYLKEYRDLLPDMIQYAEKYLKDIIWYTQWVIIDREEHLLTGAFNFLGPPTADGGVFLAFFGTKIYVEERYMEEALQGVLSWLLSQKRINYICCETERTDLEEIWLLESIGFKRGEQGNATFLWIYEPKRGKIPCNRKLTF